MTHTHPGDLLDRLIKENQISEGELSRATRVPQPTIHRIRSRESRDPRRRTLMPLARYFGISVEDFYAAGSARDPHPVREKAPPVYEHRLVPLLSWQQAGAADDKAAVNPPATKGHPETLIPVLDDVGPRAFALRVEGDAMTNPYGAPTFPAGTVIIVDPDRLAESGSFIVAGLADRAELTFKQLVLDGSRRLLKPINPRYPVTDPIGELEIRGVVVAKAYETLRT